MVKLAAFDSGIGGLSAVAPLLKQRQGIEVHYFGDLANLPYGTKSPERVRELTKKNLTWLFRRESFDLGLIACNTASAHGLEAGILEGLSAGIPVLGVIEANCQQALALKARRIVVLATASTVRSLAYPKTLERLGCRVPVLQQACPLFVPLVEDGVFDGPALEWVARKYLDPLLQAGDAVILGCTHYPFLHSCLETLYREVSWLEPGPALLFDPQVESFVKKTVSLKKVPNQLKMFFSDSTVTNESVERLLGRLSLERLAFTLELVKPLV